MHVLNAATRGRNPMPESDIASKHPSEIQPENRKRVGDVIVPKVPKDIHAALLSMRIARTWGHAGSGLHHGMQHARKRTLLVIQLEHGLLVF